MFKSFEELRPALERQYDDVKYDPASGWSGEEFQKALDEHLAAKPDEPRIATRAWLFELICEHARIAPEPDETFPDKFEHHGLLVALREKWLKEEREKEFPDELPGVPGSYISILDLSHTSPDWRNIMNLGLTGLRDRAASGKGDFHKSVARVYAAAAKLCGRLGEASANDALLALAKRPPMTFREALQLACVYNELQEMEGEWLRSMGPFDRLFIEFYRADLAAGRLTRDDAKYLLKRLWIKYYARTKGLSFGKPFLFGPDDNELSELGFEVFGELKVVDPKLHVRISKATSPAFLKQVAATVVSGCGSVAITNDERNKEMLFAHGRAKEDLDDYVLIGCYEPAIMGKEMNCSCSTLLNLGKSVETVLARATASGDFESLCDSYLDVLDSQFELAAETTRRHERLWPRVNPSPLLSGTMDPCLEKGRDVSDAGAKYNMSGCVCVGLANAVDSLVAIRHLVYERRLCSLAGLKAALSANWKGFDDLRRAAIDAPKWGNDEPSTRALAKRITSFLGERINKEPNARGGFFQAALYGISVMAKDFGRNTGALPDGRLAGESLTMNSGATPGCERDGVTALLNSVSKLDLAQFPSGTVLDVLLHPSALDPRDGANTLCALIKGYFAQGGVSIQFNIFDLETLKAARREPEKYAFLQVRLCGWSVRFVDLSPDEQDVFIRKAAVLSRT